MVVGGGANQQVGAAGTRRAEAPTAQTAILKRRQVTKPRALSSEEQPRKPTRTQHSGRRRRLLPDCRDAPSSRRTPARRPSVGARSPARGTAASIRSGKNACGCLLARPGLAVRAPSIRGSCLATRVPGAASATDQQHGRRRRKTRRLPCGRGHACDVPEELGGLATSFCTCRNSQRVTDTRPPQGKPGDRLFVRIRVLINRLVSKDEAHF